MSSLVPFSFETREIRVLTIDGEPWFVAKDVAEALEYSEASNPARLFANVPDEWKGVKPIHTLGGIQDLLCLSEPGFYFFCGRSDKPKALPFQKWAAGEVFPAIRKTGRYEAPEAAESPGLTSEQWAVLRDLMYDISRYCNHREQAHFAVNERLRFQFGLRSSSELRPEHFEEAKTDLEGLHVLAKHHRDQLIALDHEFIRAVLRPPVSVRKVRAMAKKQAKLPPLSF